MSVSIIEIGQGPSHLSTCACIASYHWGGALPAATPDASSCHGRSMKLSKSWSWNKKPCSSSWYTWCGWNDISPIRAFVEQRCLAAAAEEGSSSVMPSLRKRDST